MLVQGRVIEAHANRTFARREIGPICTAERDGSALRPLETCKQRQKRAFAGTRRSDDRDQPTAWDFERNVLQDWSGARTLSAGE